jgi:hypothetical protein
MSDSEKEAGASGDPLHAAADKIRDAAKWVLTTAGAIGAVLLAGVKLSNVADLELGWKILAFGVVAAGVFALGAAVFGVSELLLPKGFTLTQVKNAAHNSVGRVFIAENPEVLRSYTSLDALVAERDSDLKNWRTAYAAWLAGPSAGTASAVKRAGLKADVSTGIANGVSDWVGYVDLRDRYQRAMRERVVPGLLIAALSGVLFAFILPPEKKDTDGDAAPSTASISLAGLSLQGARLPGVGLEEADLSGANLTNADLTKANLKGANLERTNLTGANLKGAQLAEAKVEGATWARTTCPDGVISDNVNQTCVGHLGPP